VKESGYDVPKFHQINAYELRKRLRAILAVLEPPQAKETTKHLFSMQHKWVLQAQIYAEFNGIGVNAFHSNIGNTDNTDNTSNTSNMVT
jgi:hypothetical protein